MSLSKPELAEIRALNGAKDLLKEWLTSYFNGASHSVGTGPFDPVEFPAVDVAFDQSPPAAQPIERPEIRPLIQTLIEKRQWFTDTQCLVTSQVNLMFWVRAKLNADANTVADLLAAILRNPRERIALAEKGIAHLRPKEPETIGDKDYIVRLVPCRAQLNFTVNF